MTDLMRKSGAVGIAAPQVGLSSNVTIIEDRTVREDKRLESKRLERVDLTVMFNSLITYRSQETATHFEGCLSTPGYHAAVSRNLSINVSWLDQNGTPQESSFTGWPARIVQHEIAHLQGRTIFEDCIHGGILHESALRSTWNSLGVEAFQESIAGSIRSSRACQVD